MAYMVDENTPIETSKRQEETKTKRKERIPLGGGHRRLSAPKPRPGMVQRWINSSPGRIDQAQLGGWSFVRDPEASKSGDKRQTENETTDIGTAMSRIVGEAYEGGGRRAYLMEIPEELYNEDQAVKYAKLNMIHAAINRDEYENKIESNRRHPDAKTTIGGPAPI